MGSKALIRGRNCILWRLGCYKNQTVTINARILGCEELLGNGISDAFHPEKSASDHTTKGTGLEILAKRTGLIDLGSRIGRSKVTLPLGSSCMWQSLRFASTSEARRPEYDSGNEHEDDQDRQQDGEALMEDRLDSIVDLGPANANSKAKNQEQSSMKQKSFASSHGIGHAIKVVASMSSYKKDEFFSALQHYWLGLRLLWLDVRISSRLMLKLANGEKTLETREEPANPHICRHIQVGPIFGFCHSPFHGVLFACVSKAVPKHATVHIQGQNERTGSTKKGNSKQGCNMPSFYRTL